MYFTIKSTEHRRTSPLISCPDSPPAPSGAPATWSFSSISEHPQLVFLAALQRLPSPSSGTRLAAVLPPAPAKSSHSSTWLCGASEEGRGRSAQTASPPLLAGLLAGKPLNPGAPACRISCWSQNTYLSRKLRTGPLSGAGGLLSTCARPRVPLWFDPPAPSQTCGSATSLRRGS